MRDYPRIPDTLERVNLAGVFPPMSTPFDASGGVDRSAIRANAARWIARGVRGVVALGSNGEAPLLDEAESDTVIAAAREAVPRDRVLLAGTGRESTPMTVAASKRAAALGADALLVRTPSYFKPRMTHDAFVAHYTAVADAVNVPVLLYNYPAVTGAISYTRKNMVPPKPVSVVSVKRGQFKVETIWRPQ